MSDSPAVLAPLDPKEQPILDTLYAIRAKLELLKGDRSCYIKSEDVLHIYNEVIAQVERLNGIRTDKRDEQNRGSLPYEYTGRPGCDGFLADGSSLKLIPFWTIVSS